MRACGICAALYCGAVLNQHSMFSQRLSALMFGNDRKCCRALPCSEAHLYPTPFGAAAFMLYQEMILLPSGLAWPVRQEHNADGTAAVINVQTVHQHHPELLNHSGLQFSDLRCFPSHQACGAFLHSKFGPRGGRRTCKVLPACRAGVSFRKCMHIPVHYFGLALCRAVLQGEVSYANFSCTFIWKLLELQVA
jgi:hypothetical protein